MITQTNKDALAISGGCKIRSEAWPARHLFGEEEKRAAVRLFDKAIQTGVGLGYNGVEESAYCTSFADFMGGGYADGVNSGTNALFVALASLDLPPFSEVIVPPITDAGGVMPVPILNCIPIPADAARGGFNVGPDEVRARITPHTSAIVVMHAAGLPVDMAGIMALAEERGLKVVEDCAQAHGSLYNGKPVGTFGHVAAFSTMFGKTHAFGGQGGVVFTKDKELHHRIRELSDRGKPSGRAADVRNVVASLNFSCDEVHAAVGRVQLAKLPEIMKRRKAIGKRLIEGCKGLASIRMVEGLSVADPVYWFVLFQFDQERFSVSKEAFVSALNGEGIPFEANYDYMPSEYEWARNRHCLGTSNHPWNSPSYKGSRNFEYPLPVAREMIELHFRLIIHENLTNDDVDDVLAALRKVEQFYLR